MLKPRENTNPMNQDASLSLAVEQIKFLTNLKIVRCLRTLKLTEFVGDRSYLIYRGEFSKIQFAVLSSDTNSDQREMLIYHYDIMGDRNFAWTNDHTNMLQAIIGNSVTIKDTAVAIDPADFEEDIAHARAEGYLATILVDCKEILPNMNIPAFYPPLKECSFSPISHNALYNELMRSTYDYYEDEEDDVEETVGYYYEHRKYYEDKEDDVDETAKYFDDYYEDQHESDDSLWGRKIHMVLRYDAKKDSLETAVYCPDDENKIMKPVPILIGAEWCSDESMIPFRGFPDVTYGQNHHIGGFISDIGRKHIIPSKSKLHTLDWGLLDSALTYSKFNQDQND